MVDSISNGKRYIPAKDLNIPAKDLNEAPKMIIQVWAAILNDNLDIEKLTIFFFPNLGFVPDVPDVLEGFLLERCV